MIESISIFHHVKLSDGRSCLLYPDYYYWYIKMNPSFPCKKEVTARG